MFNLIIIVFIINGIVWILRHSLIYYKKLINYKIKKNIFESLIIMKKDYLLIMVTFIIIVIIAAIILLIPSSFNEGVLNYNEPDGWSKDSVSGTFDSNTLFSQVIYSKEFTQGNTTTKAYIIIQITPYKTEAANSTDQLAYDNSANSDIYTYDMNNYNVAEGFEVTDTWIGKTALIKNGKYAITVKAISPLFKSEEVFEDYNQLIKTISIKG